MVLPVRAAASGSQRETTGYTGKIAVPSRFSDLVWDAGKIAHKTIRLQKLWTDRYFAVATGNIQHVGRLG